MKVAASSLAILSSAEFRLDLRPVTSCFRLLMAVRMASMDVFDDMGDRYG